MYTYAYTHSHAYPATTLLFFYDSFQLMKQLSFKHSGQFLFGLIWFGFAEGYS